MSSSAIINKVLIVGATGATGNHVARMLLDRGDTTVVAVARSKGKLMDLLKIDDNKEEPNLIVKETTILDMAPQELTEITEGCGAIVSCLGHNISFRGMYRDGYFLEQTVQKLTKSMLKSKEKDGSNCRFILMGSEGVAHPDGKTDPKRSNFERCVLFLLRWLVPPHADNEKAALYLHQNPSFDWSVVRPGDLFNKKEVKDDDSKGAKGYEIFDHPQGALFGDNPTARSDVADFMVGLATMDQNTWEEKFNHKMPVVYGKKEEEKCKPDETKKSK
uniref:NAD(P)-binding domain-containing protein n=2 Tax=Pseudo-nitzschia australis TaxID=44445 RepID=A0A7S4AX65_9STRA|mmetsp:Transcript_8155/g.17579  ORF Transcript_8155/g.17579 Transcript_8155/m.17579 type:complete len:275 (+) Transcript_8155:222-1046(+)|eukprot:CAMPEP_0168185822 /NCGR_PEP_ID=MMETSP0139_2-20121125/14064_1 /TAXON_ID=44445 /ORGANISM="Pseudo-nitzschia australis, Strain 10249 10 AB" /LENGTH=274 /DNA_ID=CAMNT_0008107709 /DNA_START=158 /DNA_END=982 /DNA_ORIENTATION=+